MVSSLLVGHAIMQELFKGHPLLLVPLLNVFPRYLIKSISLWRQLRTNPHTRLQLLPFLYQMKIVSLNIQDWPQQMPKVNSALSRL